MAATEVIWTALGLLGMAVSVPNLLDAYKDLIALNFTGANGALRYVAIGNVREEFLRTLKTVVITVVGVVAMLIGPANPEAPISPLSLLVTAGLFLISAFVVLGSVSARRTRQRVVRAPRSNVL